MKLYSYKYFTVIHVFNANNIGIWIQYVISPVQQGWSVKGSSSQRNSEIPLGPLATLLWFNSPTYCRQKSRRSTMGWGRFCRGRPVRDRSVGMVRDWSTVLEPLPGCCWVLLPLLYCGQSVMQGKVSEVLLLGQSKLQRPERLLPEWRGCWSNLPRAKNCRSVPAEDYLSKTALILEESTF